MLTQEAALRELARRELERRAITTDPLRLVSYMVGVDQRDGSRFDFSHIRDPLQPGEVRLDERTLRRRDNNWRWQRYVAEQALRERRLIILKGRQIGVTWILLAVDVAEAITMPGTSSLLFRQREDEAVDNVRRWWTLYKSLPAWLTGHIKVLKPDLGRTMLPGREGILLGFPDGELSEIVPMSSAASSGHGRTVRRVIADEGAYIDRLEQIMAAIEPAAGPAAINIVSTANGRSNEETGEGNEYHRRYVDDGSGYEKLFLPFDVHPDRDEAWRETAPEVRSLKPHQRAAQFPRNEHEAFALSSRVFFDSDALEHYASLVRQPIDRLDFVDPVTGNLAKGKTAKVRRHDNGFTSIFDEPQPGHRYAIGADVATGHGRDYSAAYVIDLTNMGIAAEFHGRLDEDLYAAQLHYLGRMYGRDVPADEKDPASAPGFAKLAVEIQGGFGNAVIAPLRDRTSGRPVYGNLYRHVLDNRGDRPIAKPYGFPMNTATRPKAVNGLEQAVRERTLPWVTARLLHEMGDFVRHDHGTSPAAADGCTDDLVMAACIALEMYRLYGQHAAKTRRKPKPQRLYRPVRHAA